MASAYECVKCGKEIKEKDFIAIIGKAPPSGLSAPVGRVDKIINDIGEIYCRDCLRRYAEGN